MTTNGISGVSLADTTAPSSPAQPRFFSRLWRRKYAVISQGLGIVFGCLLLLSSITKLQNSYAFLATLDQYELLGPRVVPVVAILLPFVELMLGACLIVGVARRAAWILVAVLFTIFVGVLASVAYRGLHTTCGCFGPLDSSDVTWTTVGHSAILLWRGRDQFFGTG